MHNMEVTNELKEEARKNPGGWVYVIDPAYPKLPGGRVLPQAIVGAWKVDTEGNIEGEFLTNKNYVPLDEGET